MQTFKVSIETFLAVKHVLDQSVFWRPIDKDTIEVKPAFKQAREFVEKIAIKE